MKEFIWAVIISLVIAVLAQFCNSAHAQEIECRTRWKPSLYKTSVYCVRYRGELWLCPVESCRRKR